MIQVSRDADQVLGTGCRMAGIRQDPCCSVETIGPENARPGRRLQVCGNPKNVTSSRFAQVSGGCSPCRDAQPSEHSRGSDAPRDRSLRSKDDSFRVEASWTTTFGDSRRQDSGPQRDSGDDDSPGWRRPLIQCDPSEDTPEERLTMINGQAIAVAPHSRALMRSGSVSRKVSVSTTKNDNMQNQLHHLQFWRGPRPLIDPPEWCVGEPVVTRLPCREKASGRRVICLIEDFKNPTNGFHDHQVATTSEPNCHSENSGILAKFAGMISDRSSEAPF